MEIDHSAPPLVTPDDIRAARERIAVHIRRTPILEAASPIPGVSLSLKLEALQFSGSFKARGAFHNLVTRPAPPAGCATASGGNHGAAVAYAAEALGVPAKVFVPEIATPAKVARIRACGAEAVVVGANYTEAQARCDAYVAESGALKIHPYDARETPSPGFGGSANGNLDYWIIHSCEVVPSPSDTAAWPNPWWNIFGGLHAVLGYRTIMYIGDGAGQPFGYQLMLGAPVVSAWHEHSHESGRLRKSPGVAWAGGRARDRQADGPPVGHYRDRPLGCDTAYNTSNLGRAGSLTIFWFPG